MQSRKPVRTPLSTRQSAKMFGKRERERSAFSADDAKPSTTADDNGKHSHEESGDSGFISGASLTVSGEILSEDNIASGPVPEQEDQHMHFYGGGSGADLGLTGATDSGVDVGLSDSFSGLSLSKSNNLNNLSCSKLQEPETAPQPPVDPARQEFPWAQYFQQDEDGDTSLHIAIVQGFLEIVKAIIRLAPHPLLLDTPNDDAQSPIHLAALTGQWRVVRWLVVAGAKPSSRNINGDSPLHIVARSGDMQCCKAITEPVQPHEREELALSYPQQPYQKFCLDQWNYEGQTCVHVAAMNGHVDVLRHLERNGADINAREGLCGYTALHYAVARGDEHLAKFLLYECKNLDPKTTTYGGCSALQLNSAVPSAILNALKSRGVPSPFSSEDEYSESDSENEMTYENVNKYLPNLVNASA